MALTYNYEKCDDSNWTKDDKQLAPQFCWSLMSIGIPAVTETNKDEIVFRLMFKQKVDQCVYTVDQTLERYIDLVNKMVGYYTNVQKQTRKQFIYNTFSALSQDIQKDINHLNNNKAA
tara:strand:+ start:985 stop:1338 length:354 start_codon:yes stop_codon:yes gene_type:complete